MLTEEVISYDLLFELIDGIRSPLGKALFLLFEESSNLFLECCNVSVPYFLFLGKDCCTHLIPAIFLNCFEDLFRYVSRFVSELLLTDLSYDAVNEFADLLNDFVTFSNSIQHYVIRYFVSSCLYHADLAQGTCKSNVHL